MYLGEAFLEIGNFVAHVANLLKSLRGGIFSRCYPNLRGVALLYCLQRCSACHCLSNALRQQPQCLTVAMMAMW